MSDAPEALPAAPVPAALPVAAPPISTDFLPPNMRKHVDPGSPVALRMMAAKTLVPLSPPDMLGALYLLTFDPDEKVRDTAAATAQKLPDRILSAALRDEDVPGPVLAYFLARLADKDAYAEMLILNANTPDDAVAAAARLGSTRTAELVGQNQLRLLRHDDIIRQLCLNPNAGAALLEGVCDFCVRSGMMLADVPALKAARLRLFGPDPEIPVDPGPTAAEVMAENAELRDEGDEPVEDHRRMTLTQKVMKMSISEKIKLATLGNKEARSLLIRDSNKLVATAVIRSPRITDGEVLAVASNRAAMDDVLRIVYGNREWTKKNAVKLALVKNPKLPLSVAMRFMATLRENEVKDLMRNKNVPVGVQQTAKRMMDKKNAPKKGD